MVVVVVVVVVVAAGGGEVGCSRVSGREGGGVDKDLCNTFSLGIPMHAGVDNKSLTESPFLSRRLDGWNPFPLYSF